MPMCDVVDLVRYWATFPPVHVLVRNFLGYKPRQGIEETKKPMRVGAESRHITAAPERVQVMVEELKKLAR